jgi:hypothetical protein
MPASPTATPGGANGRAKYENALFGDSPLCLSMQIPRGRFGNTISAQISSQGKRRMRFMARQSRVAGSRFAPAFRSESNHSSRLTFPSNAGFPNFKASAMLNCSFFPSEQRMNRLAIIVQYADRLFTSVMVRRRLSSKFHQTLQLPQAPLPPDVRVRHSWQNLSSTGCTKRPFRQSSKQTRQTRPCWTGGNVSRP